MYAPTGAFYELEMASYPTNSVSDRGYSLVSQVYYCQHNLVLKGMDAIHVASALDAKCKEFLTWDTDMSNQKAAEKITTLHGLGMMVITPSQSELLPPHYKQDTLLKKAKAK
jgi:hypothetical protein